MEVTVETFKQLIDGKLGRVEIVGSSGSVQELGVEGMPTALSIWFTETGGDVEIGYVFDHEGDYAKLTRQEVGELERYLSNAYEWEEPERDDEPDGMDIRKRRLEDGY
jgi:hypothetical protein